MGGAQSLLAIWWKNTIQVHGCCAHSPGPMTAKVRLPAQTHASRAWHCKYVNREEEQGLKYRARSQVRETSLDV